MGQTWQGPALLTLLCQFQPLYSVSHDFWSLKMKGSKGTGIVVAIWHYAGIILFEPSRLASGAFIFLLKMFPAAIPQFQWIGQPWFSWKSKRISVSPGSLFVLQWLCIQYQLQLIFARFFFFLLLSGYLSWSIQHVPKPTFSSNEGPYLEQGNTNSLSSLILGMKFS